MEELEGIYMALRLDIAKSIIENIPGAKPVPHESLPELTANPNKSSCAIECFT